MTKSISVIALKNLVYIIPDTLLFLLLFIFNYNIFIISLVWH